MASAVSDLFDPAVWTDVPGFGELTDITYHHDVSGRIARIAFDRPEVRNAFRPHTVDELYAALEDARTNPRIGVVLLTGNGPSPKDGGWAFCSGAISASAAGTDTSTPRVRRRPASTPRAVAGCTSSRCSG
ncbi:enoyl-CoA hydratase-related protein [Streptomyces sp. L7]|uniref:enoyl-CoA hydratase-related protein n=1 Tax=Streptomyces sp. L7 TaxID=3423954 RepID=UPI003D97E6B6